MHDINLPRGKLSPEGPRVILTEMADLYNAYRQRKHVISDKF